MIAFVLLSLFCFSVESVGPFPRCSGKENTLKIYTDEPVLLKKVENGKLYRVGNKTVNSSWNIAHLYGKNDYEMGFALGALLKDELVYFFEVDWETYIDMIIEKYASFIPKKVRKLLEEYGAGYVLNELYRESIPYTPHYFFDYMGGISSSSTVPLEKIIQFNYIPQLTAGGCSIIGSWGSGTPTGDMIQVRDFDLIWKEVGIIPLMRFPTFQVFHYNSGNSVVNINTAGFVGALSGFNSYMVSLSQKFYPTLDSIDPFKKGFPWHFMLFHGLRESKNVIDFLDLVKTSERTVSTYLGLGDGKDFYGVEMKFYNVKVFGWENQTTYSKHPKIEDTVYWDKEDFQPAKSYCLSDLLKGFHGNLTADNVIRYVNAVGETGDSMAVVYDFKDHQVYASWGLTTPAYDKQYVRLDMKKLVDEKYDDPD